MSSDTEMLDYLRNIDTRPGPNAGRSIDPTKPGPDADRIADRRPPNCRFRLQDEGKPYPRSGCTGCGATITTGLGTYCTRLRNVPSPAPSPEPQDVREALLAVDRHPGITIRCEDDEAAKVWNHLCTVVKSAIAQSDAQPVGWQYEALAKAVQQMESEKISAESNGSSKGAYIRGFYELYPAFVRHSNEDKIAHARRIKEFIYASAPHPDASGLVEAAEWHEEQAEINEMTEAEAEACGAPDKVQKHHRDLATFHKESAKLLRSRAADRSGE